MARYPIISDDPQIQQDYVKSRKSGASHKLAEMLALQIAPGLQTDTRFQSGHVNHNQFAHDPVYGAMALENARKAGVSVEGAVYHEQLAQFPGDPQAWVRTRGDVLKICQERGRTVTGAVNYKPAMDEGRVPDTPYEAADDIVQHELDKMEAKYPNAAKDDPGLEQRIRDAVSGRVDLNCMDDPV